MALTMERPVQVDRAAIEAYLVAIGYDNARIETIRDLTQAPGDSLKEFGYGHPILIVFRAHNRTYRVVFHTHTADAFGHDRRSDRAAALLLADETYNTLPQHVRCLNVGAFKPDGQLLSLGDAGEFFLLTEYADGELYAQDLARIRDTGQALPGDIERARTLAAYLAEIHAIKKSAPVLYERHLRDTIGHGEGIMGLTDSYPPDYAPAPPAFLEAIEQQCIRWRWRLKAKSSRLSQIHGDFHPFNILFRTGTDFSILDRSRGAWGEPADDVSALSINYLFYALQQNPDSFDGPLAALFTAFWTTYLDMTNDREILTVIAPFFAWRGLVIASPLWYPNLHLQTRQTLFRFIRRVLEEEQFDPAYVNAYLS